MSDIYPATSLDDLVAALRALAVRHREQEREAMSDGVPELLERAARALEKWKAIADGREEQARINHGAYEKLRAEVEGR